MTSPKLDKHIKPSSSPDKLPALCQVSAHALFSVIQPCLIYFGNASALCDAESSKTQ